MTEDASLSDFLEDEAEAAAGDGDDTAEDDDAGSDAPDVDSAREDSTSAGSGTVDSASDAGDALGDDEESERGAGTTPERTDEDGSDSPPERTDEDGSDSPDSGSTDLERTDPGGIDPLRPTYAWGNDVACADCGDRVERAWRDGDEYVCGSCKDW